jgi:hypothetical protein
MTARAIKIDKRLPCFLEGGQGIKPDPAVGAANAAKAHPTNHVERSQAPQTNLVLTKGAICIKKEGKI